MTNTYKLVCSDIDGTLLDSKRSLAKATIETVKELDKRHVPFVMISARMPRAMRPFQQVIGINQPIVCFNGAYIETELRVDGSAEVLHDNPIDYEAFIALLAELDNHNVHVSTFYQNQWFANKNDYWAKREVNNTRNEPEFLDLNTIGQWYKMRNHGAHKVLVMGDAENIEPLFSKLHHLFDDEVDIYRSKDTYLEINASAVSKSTAIDVLTEYFNTTEDKIVAYGDNYNDVEMLRRVGYGVAVENGRNEAKAVSNEITDKNISDGVAKSLKKIFNI